MAHTLLRHRDIPDIKKLDVYLDNGGYDGLKKALSMSPEDATAIVKNYEYRFQYSNNYTYHPFHALSMISGGSASLLWTSGVFLPGAKSARRRP